MNMDDVSTIVVDVVNGVISMRKNSLVLENMLLSTCLLSSILVRDLDEAMWFIKFLNNLHAFRAYYLNRGGRGLVLGAGS